MVGVKINFFKSKIKNSLFQNVELVELITNHPSCNYPSCTVTEIFESLFSLCIGFFMGTGGAQNFFFVQNRNFFFSECRARRADHESPQL